MENEARTHVVFGFGTSSLYGAWDPFGGWFNRLRTYYDSKNASDQSYYSFFYNLGIDGNTTLDILKRFNTEVKPRASKQKSENIIVFDVGKNDLAIIRKTDKNRVSPEEFAENIRKLKELSSVVASTTLFLGILPVVQEDGAEYEKWVPDIIYTSQNISKYDRILEKVAAGTSSRYIDLKKPFTGRRAEEVLDDGLHMNSVGHEIVFQTVKEYLDKKHLFE